MPEIEGIGRDWLIDEVGNMADHIDRMDPVTYNERHRYLPQGVSPRPGFIRYDLFPFLREIIECFDPLSPVREVNLKKGVQTGFTTLLESILLYYIGHIKTAPAMFITADKELAAARMENNILPMLIESDMGHLIRSSDVGNSRKTGKTKDFLQWDGGGFLMYQGALNAAKMRQTSVPLMLKDELDGWKREVGKDGNSDSLTDARLSAYWSVRKILRGSTPLIVPSLIDEAFDRGDKRVYKVRCFSCSFPQELRFETINRETGIVGGFQWETEGGNLILESVRYCCSQCGHPHYEHDKERLFSSESGAKWEPTAIPRESGIRSYHLPAFYSPYGFRPWSKNVSDYLGAFDPETKQIISISKYQEFYNNTLGEPFRVMGAKIRFEAVSSHRRSCYLFGEIPNAHALEYAESPILLLTCEVDVQKKDLAVAVFGWTRGMRSYLVDYWRFEVPDGAPECPDLSSSVWGRLRELIEEKVYEASDGKKYRIALTLIDASYEGDTVLQFCSEYAWGVFPIMGRDRPGKNQKISEFKKFTTQLGTTGFLVTVDHYKDRLAPVLRREWTEDAGIQKSYHFNAPMNVTDAQLKELTVETRKEKTDERGNVSYYWHRPGGSRNELWDLLGYGHAAVEILAWVVCIEHFELETIDWLQFWEYIEKEKLYFSE